MHQLRLQECNSEFFIKGALFHTLHDEQNDPELSFQYAVHRINSDNNLLPDTYLVHRIIYIKKESFQTQNTENPLSIPTKIYNPDLDMRYTYVLMSKSRRYGEILTSDLVSATQNTYNDIRVFRIPR